MALGPVSKEMIETAIGDGPTESRALATQAIGRMVRDIKLTETERRLANQIFDVLSRDVTEEVRRALAVTLRLSKNLPRAIANRLIHDVDTIAEPILSSSPVVTDNDLIVVLRSRAGTKAQAVASRHRLSRKVSKAVINFGDATSIATLAANDTALISKEDAAQMIRLAKSSDLIREAALRRQDLPQDLAVQLINLQVEQVDEALQPKITEHAQIANETGERAKARWSASDWSSDAMQAYVEALDSRGSLDEAIIARAAGQGDWRFVQLALARRAGISSAKAGMMVLDVRTFGLKALLHRAALCPQACELIIASAGAFRDVERSGATVSREQFQRLMVERIASHPSATEYGELWLDWLDDGLGPQLVA